VDWVYRVPEEPLAELIPRLENSKSEEDVKERLRDVVARAFDGIPVPEGQPFAELAPDQQLALQAIIRLDDYYWRVSGLLRQIFKSYNLPEYERLRLERYVAGSHLGPR
jgi:hypothetical protein